jgi:adenosine deaminase
MCADTFGWTMREIIDLAHNSVTASFADDDLKRDLHAEISAFGTVSEPTQ